MLKTTPDIPLLKTPHGLRVVPDVLVFPLRARSRGDSPLAALESLEEREAAVRQAAPTAELDPVNYRSWTEAFAGKGLRGRGIRYCTSANLRLRVQLGPRDSVAARRRTLETLRTALIPLDDGDQLTVGSPTWEVANPEAHRDAWARELRARAESLEQAFGGLAQLSGAIGELEVESVGPRHAYIRFAAQLRMHAAPTLARPAPV